MRQVLATGKKAHHRPSKMCHVIAHRTSQHRISLFKCVEHRTLTLVSQRSVLDALEERYPMLRGTMRDHVTHLRRPMVRFFACGEDLSHELPDAPLPDAITKGSEPFLIIGAIAGG